MCSTQIHVCMVPAAEFWGSVMVTFMIKCYHSVTSQNVDRYSPHIPKLCASQVHHLSTSHLLPEKQQWNISKMTKKRFLYSFFNPIYIQQIMFNSFWCLENHVSIIFITSQPYLFNIQLIMSEWHSCPTNHIYVLFMSWQSCLSHFHMRSVMFYVLFWSMF